MPQHSWYLVGYDVRDDKRLRKVAKLLEGYGGRIQYSLFRCRLSKRQAADLKWELSRVLEIEDSLLMTGLCERCADSLRAESVSVDLPTAADPWEVV